VDEMHMRAMRSALRKMRANGGEDKRPALAINIGVEPGSEGYEKDPRGGPQDPDAEIYGDADDDDPELPGSVRRRR
jgi:hypothetical protein